MTQCSFLSRDLYAIAAQLLFLWATRHHAASLVACRHTDSASRLLKLCGTFAPARFVCLFFCYNTPGVGGKHAAHMIGAARLAAGILHESEAAGGSRAAGTLSAYRPKRRGRARSCRSRTPYEGEAIDNHLVSAAADAPSSQHKVPCESERRALDRALARRNYAVIEVQPVYEHKRAKYVAHADLLCEETNSGERVIVECKAGCGGNPNGLRCARLQAAFQALAEEEERSQKGGAPQPPRLRAVVLRAVASRRNGDAYRCEWHEVTREDFDAAERAVARRLGVNNDHGVDARRKSASRWDIQLC